MDQRHSSSEIVGGEAHDDGMERRIGVRLKLREFITPPVRDALVLGKKSPIDCPALRRALTLLNPVPFEHIEFEDDVVSDILVRASILRRIPRDRLIRLVVQRVKPFMDATDVIQMEIDAEAFIDAEV